MPMPWKGTAFYQKNILQQYPTVKSRSSVQLARNSFTMSLTSPVACLCPKSRIINTKSTFHRCTSAFVAAYPFSPSSGNCTASHPCSPATTADVPASSSACGVCLPSEPHSPWPPLLTDFTVWPHTCNVTSAATATALSVLTYTCPGPSVDKMLSHNILSHDKPDLF
ncbi:hypothetical protein Vretimale_16641 [Volvox reticuliferus]|uniref:Uncharacterized protein n=1 Tax=Volvox reticuliferus TaxID=1737510 RepID=A0A8J4CZ62_9CHLO|nr:hypothetical protein Vretifemale_17469 [Volvox reticuliferus]GIM13552.1 hypothetical protein Vretimale_16641 [Volvox reticuliferus]